MNLLIVTEDIELTIGHLKNILSWSIEIYDILNNFDGFLDNNIKQSKDFLAINFKIEWIIFAAQSAIRGHNES